MSQPFFQFKQFTVWHDKCAMKVGTDGVLLGAWTPVESSARILDIGTGHPFTLGKQDRSRLPGFQVIQQ